MGNALTLTTTDGVEKQLELKEDIENLQLGASNIATIDLEPLRLCTNLRTLNLSMNQIRSINLEPLKSCSMLEHLSLDQNQIETIDLKPLCSCINLLTLRLGNNKFKDIDLSPLDSLPKLQSLDIRDTREQISDVKPSSTNIESPMQIVKAFVQYYRHEYDNGIHFWYLTEIHVKTGTTVRELLQFLVNGEIEKMSPYGYMPAVHYSFTYNQGGGIVYCESMPTMLRDFRGNKPSSFIVTYRETKVPRDGESSQGWLRAKLTDNLHTGDVLLLRQMPSTHTRSSSIMTLAIMLGSALDMMVNEEKKGQTKEPVISKEFIDRHIAR